MERKKVAKYLIATELLLFGSLLINAQQDHRKMVYEAFVLNRMEKWDRAINEMKAELPVLNKKEKLELLNYYYGYIGWAIDQGMKKKARTYLEQGETLIDELQEKYPGMPELYAYRGALIGYAIGMNPLKAIILGPESMKNINYALEIGPAHPQGWIEHGNAYFYMPSMFGGSKKTALEDYLEAVRLMQQDPDKLSNNWMYLNLLLRLGQCYDYTGNARMAKITYEKALELEPRFTFLRDEIYPEFLEKLSES